MSKFLKSLCKIAIPVTLQSMLQSSFSIVDQIMIGQLGETNISAVGLCGNFSLIFSVMIGAVSTVAGILIAQFIGAEESKEAWCSFDVSLICGIIMSVLFLLAAGVFPSQILGLYTKDMSIVNRNSTVPACSICIQVGNCWCVYIAYHGGIVQACCIVHYL